MNRGLQRSHNWTFEGVRLPELSYAIVGNGRDMTDASVRVIEMGCVDLLSIDMIWCTQLTYSRWGYSSALQRLYFPEYEWIHRDWWWPFWGLLMSLFWGAVIYNLSNLPGCDKLTDVLSATIGESCRGLIITDESLIDKMAGSDIACSTQRCSYVNRYQTMPSVHGRIVGSDGRVMSGTDNNWYELKWSKDRFFCRMW